MDKEVHGFFRGWLIVIPIAILIDIIIICVLYSKLNAQWYDNPVKEAFLWATDTEKWYVPGPVTVFFAASICGFTADALRDMENWQDPQPKLLGRQGQWHGWRDGSNIGYGWTAMILARQIIVDDMSYKEAFLTLVKMGGVRFLTRAFYKINKGGLGAYNDPLYNKHAIVYPKVSIDPLSFTDGYISTGKWTTPLLDLAVSGLLIIIREE